jgi:dethiobiotin synthetase
MRVVVLGTGTNVGKTYVTARLANALAKTTRVLALKPVESGVTDEAATDAATIARGAGHPAVASPWRFAEPVSPHLAARACGAVLSVPEIAHWVVAAERRYQPDVTLVETAGGVFSPLSPIATNADLAGALESSLWLLVAPDSLGVLHDVSATLRALRAGYRRPDAVVLSSPRAPDASSGTNAAELAKLGITDVRLTLGPNASGVDGLAAWPLAQANIKDR